MSETTKKYSAIDGLRAFAAVGIVLMHVLANSRLSVSGFIPDKLINSFTNFVFLFMAVSAFGLCCGYYEKVIEQRISFETFYKKRFAKILPFFALLALAEFIVSPSLNALWEVFADLTLMFGFLPGAGNITVIGVGWFLGIVFVFYLVFPFFCFLISNKKRAWIAFVISIIFNFACALYFNVGRTNFLYCSCFFMLGGILYLYKDQIERIPRVVAIVFVIMTIAFYYLVSAKDIVCLPVSAALLIYAMVAKKGFLDNPIVHFLSGISLEMYLSHMMVFRILEKIGLTTLFGKGWVQYLVSCVLTLTGAIIIAIGYQVATKRIKMIVANKMRRA